MQLVSQLLSAVAAIERPDEEGSDLGVGEVGVDGGQRPAAVKPVVHQPHNKELISHLQG